ncbi:hypothetical protein KSD_77330 [Ktedonobacter sp. SOSP1-85]|uniref:AAA family ATPase n=1 Tax=Ktedonobacter sp. SOSP1-85 TaxID=2778367 RepID=UPI0019159A44|nr:AAA family ATPase [Ktedonobacter sp. SOSP1-85]GHO79962.1 hypothetical protein KSD_77330 [Ktedonobacter sp. SOSP1-85]
MITLKYLRANNFKGLRSVYIAFPDQGSILIEGQNEAGKSTLFEAIYVALYGKPLVGEEKLARQDEVIQHGQASAFVELALSVGSQILIVTRYFERGKTQQVTLKIQRPDGSEEIVQRIRAVNDRILKELGNLDGDCLRNSCFVEQKELGRIEDLAPTDREKAVHKLLGLDRLTKLISEFKFKPDQREELRLAERRLVLAQLQAKERVATAREAELAERLDAVKVTKHLGRVSDLAAQRAALETALSVCKQRVQEARERLAYCEKLKEQIACSDQVSQRLISLDHTCEELRRSEEELARLKEIKQAALPAASAYLSDVTIAAEAVAQVVQARQDVQQAKMSLDEAQHQLRELKQAEEEQQRKEQALVDAQERLRKRRVDAAIESRRLVQELSALEEKRTRLEQALTLVRQWEAACEQRDGVLREIDAAQARRQELLRLQDAIQQWEREVQRAEVATSQAEQELQQVMSDIRLSTAHDAVSAWIRLKGVEMAISDYARRQSIVLTRQQATEAELAIARNRTRSPLYAGVILMALALLAFMLGVLWAPALVLFLCLLGGAIACWLWFMQARKRMRNPSAVLDQCKRESQYLDMQRQAAIQAGGDPLALRHYEQQLQTSGFAIPADVVTGSDLQENLRKQLEAKPGLHALQEAAQRVQGKHAALTEQLKQARACVEENRNALSLVQEMGDPAPVIDVLQARLAEHEGCVTTIAQQAQQFWVDGLWPSTSSTVQLALATCTEKLNAAKAAQEQHERNTTTFIDEAEADRRKAEMAVHQAKDLVIARQAGDPITGVLQAQEALNRVEALCLQQEADMHSLLQKIAVPTEKEVELERGRAQSRVQSLEDDWAKYPSLQKDYQEQKDRFNQELTSTSVQLRNLLDACQLLHITGLPSCPVMPEESAFNLPYEEVLRTTLSITGSALQNALDVMDELGTRTDLEKALGEQGQIAQRIKSNEVDVQQHQQTINSILTGRGLAHPSIYTTDSLIVCWPLIAVVSSDEENQVTNDLEQIRKDLYAVGQQVRSLSDELQQPETPLDIDECQQKVDELREERQICDLGARLIQETRDRIARHVLPITERNMQPLLQQLTGGRYRDVRLTSEESNGAPSTVDYRIRVWDPAAGRFVAKNLFSGGTRDQCSLALRLAFALATLPQELGVAPGFIFLDEPLSAFDSQRAQALVELLSTGIIAQQFNQVILISHVHAFDRDAFHYHVHMEGGQIVASDLPLEESEKDVLAVSATRGG